MNKLTAILATSLGVSALAAAPSFAVEVTGGDISLGYSAFTEDTDFSRFGVEGSIEVGFNQSFGVQFDLSHYAFGFSEGDVTNGTIHAIYHVNDLTSVGLFYGREEIEGLALDFYGLEAGHEFAAVDVEAYVAFGNEGGVSATVFGLEAEYDINDHFAVGIAYDHADFEGVVSLHNTSLRATYSPAESYSVYGEIGSAGIGVDVAGLSVGASRTFFGLGVEMAFGAQRGATFGERGLARMVPGL